MMKASEIAPQPELNPFKPSIRLKDWERTVAAKMVIMKEKTAKDRIQSTPGISTDLIVVWNKSAPKSEETTLAKMRCFGVMV